MRHPRSRSRYFIAIGVATVYGLMSFVPIAMNWGLSDRRLIAYLGAISGSGIVPIVYRMLSKHKERLGGIAC